ncbi:hypothetical protein M413DRAFT_149591 [Hebeloma cylindrosporum]|uniref:Uncharacterized protein n=1 Tax=Hebeloma cylindrosporum TaxID=76867 RepID=A0A0C3CCY9_HEBCY|nr:hypothetical protein M413DRAFT_149591 [Hebeloma cylindrosporum h7]
MVSGQSMLGAQSRRSYRNFFEPRGLCSCLGKYLPDGPWRNKARENATYSIKTAECLLTNLALSKPNHNDDTTFTNAKCKLRQSQTRNRREFMLLRLLIERHQPNELVPRNLPRQ